ncbi:MAG: hypothetical protein JXA14_22850 [Anaerolineae bacterium]|nr:hypothetical protein [Anaerolineae bacterium]
MTSDELQPDIESLLSEMKKAVTAFTAAWSLFLATFGVAVADVNELCPIVDGNRIAVPAWSTPDEMDETVLALARAIQGEGAGLFGEQRDQVGLWIGHCAMNRIEAGWWEDAFKTPAEQIADAFHGCANVPGRPQLWALRLAKMAYGREEDIAGGVMFMLSRADVKKLGPLSRAPDRVFESDQGLQLQFFKLWPVVNRVE